MLVHLRKVHRGQAARLRELAVGVNVLSPARSREELSRFAEMFLGVERAGSFLAEAGAAAGTGREIEYGKWLWDGAPPPKTRPQFGWLSDWMPGTSCVRFDRRPMLPALSFPVAAMLDAWALSWPGAYVAFSARRAIVVSLDREVSCFDPDRRGSPAVQSPYR
ncbi:MAG: hypothetical protein R3F14_07435 [Polyangiaceae bacterium]